MMANSTAIKQSFPPQKRSIPFCLALQKALKTLLFKSVFKLMVLC